MNLKNVVSQDVVSLNEEKTPIEGHNPKHKSKWKSWEQTVILISLDGFRAEYLKRKHVPTLQKLVKQSISSNMHPVFPTSTFPNHYSMVTGMYPYIHGIVNNKFYDPALRDTFSIEKSVMKDPKWWKTNPIWNIVQEQGQASAVSFWPGCAVPINGWTPTHFIQYEENYDNIRHMENILKWIDYPPSVRPSLIMAYLPAIDAAGHAYGPNSNEIDRVLADVDKAIGFLIEELKTRNIFGLVNLLIVSDHGMSYVPSKNIIYAEDIFPLNLTFAIYYGAVAFIIPLAEDYGKEIYDRLSEYSYKHGKFKVYLKSELPSEWYFGDNARIAPILVVCEPSYYFHSRTAPPAPLGVHEYPLPNEEMEAIFIAHGGRIRKADQLQPPYSTFGPFSCLDIFPFIAKLLEIKAPENNGTNYLVDGLVLPSRQQP